MTDPASFARVREAVVQAFSAAKAAEFLRSLDRASARIREFEAVLAKGLLGAEMSG